MTLLSQPSVGPAPTLTPVSPARGRLQLHILGTRGIPAKHGGFETFAEQFALYMTARGHETTVYCQNDRGTPEGIDTWKGVRRVSLSESDGAKGTVSFDLRSALMASREKDATLLTLGYNTAIFSLIHRLRGVRHFMNMDGVEWRRQKWNGLERLWLRSNEWCGTQFVDSLIADHPVIKQHLSTLVDSRKITVIPYGADAVTEASATPLAALGLAPNDFYVVIARPEPENSILEIVQAFAYNPRGTKLVLLGKYTPSTNAYHARVLAAAEGKPILFPGAIYDANVVASLRFHAKAYIHGHQVGGTNPSLVEALAAGCAVIAHRNPYNRWVAGEQARYFGTVAGLSQHFDTLETSPDLLGPMRASSRERHQQCFRRELILEAYEDLLLGTGAQMDCWTL